MPKASAQDVAASEPRTGTRDALLGAAATAIAESGWGNVTTRQVAALAGVNPGLVHYHFGSMDVLRREAALHVLATTVEGPALALLDPGPLAAGVTTSLAKLAEIEPRSEAALVLYEAMLAGTRDPELGALLNTVLEEFKAQLALRIGEAGGRHPVAGAALLAAALDGLVLHRAVNPDLDPTTVAPCLVAALGLED
ncbi:MAG: TetR/AcrR family transcriptional regulator [Acidimicrobiales bacterium]